MVNKCSQYSQNPNKAHKNALSAIWGYLKRYPQKYLKYNCCLDNIGLKAYSDADFANDPNIRKSITGFIVCLDYKSNPISWSSQKQQTISTSTIEAEYVANYHASTEIIYLKRTLLNILNILKVTPNSIPKTYSLYRLRVS